MVTGLASRESLSLINLVSHIGLGGPVDRAKDMLVRWTGAELLGGTGRSRAGGERHRHRDCQPSALVLHAR